MFVTTGNDNEEEIALASENGVTWQKIYTQTEIDTMLDDLQNVELTAETGSGTDTTTPAISSTISSVLQVIWNKIRQLVNAKQNTISAGTNGRLRTSSGTAGTVNELSSTVGSTQLPVYVNAGVPTAITQANLRIGIFGSTAVGSTQLPVYFAANGVPTAITQANLRIGLFGTTAVGGASKPVYIAANGVPTAISDTVGSTQLPVYSNSGTLTALTQANLRIGIFGTTAIGSNQLPVYLAANGVPTALTQANLRIGIFGTTAVGSASQPVYIAANGVPTAATAPILPAGGTMTGVLTAGGTQAVGTAQVRNIRASTTDLTAGTSELATGQVYLVYE